MAPAFPLALIPSQLMTPAIWDRVRPALAARSEIHHADITQDDSIAAMAARLLATMPPRFDLAAIGMGGFVALAVLRQAPGRIRRLALISTLAEADDDAQRTRRQHYADLVQAGAFEDVAEERIPLMLPDPEKAAALGGIVRAMARDTGPGTFLQQQRAIMARIDSRPMLSAIPCPVLILRGTGDRIMQPRHLDDLRAGIAQAQTIELNCGHLVPLEVPEQAGALLARHFSASD